MMKRFFYFTLMLAVFATTLISCQDKNGNIDLNDGPTGPDSYAFGYCTNDMKSGIGTGAYSILGAAVQINKDDLVKNGNEIVGIRCGLNGSGENFTVYIVNDLMDDESDALFMKNIGTVDGYSWVYVALDEPINVDEVGDLFFAYSLETSEYALGYEPGTGTERDWVFAGQWQLLSQAGLYGKLNIQAVLTGGDYSDKIQYNVVPTYIELPSVVVAGETQTMTCHVTNLGVKFVNNIEINYTYGGTSGTHRVSNIGLMYGQSVAIELPSVTTKGSGSIEVSVATTTKGQEGINSVAGEQTVVEGGNYERTVLLEHFTGQSCPNCPAGVTAIKNSLNGLSEEERERVVWVSHHAGYGDDSFTLTESKTISSFLGVPGAPMICIDRERTNTELGLVYHPSYTNANTFRDKLKVTSMGTVKIDHEYNVATREIKMTVSGISPTAAPRLTVMLIQSGLSGTQSGATSGYIHDNAPRHFFTQAMGDAINFNNGEYSQEFTYTIPATIGAHNCIPENMEIVAFLDRKSVV